MTNQANSRKNTAQNQTEHSQTKTQGDSAWQTVQLARHPERPLFLDYVAELFTEFDQLCGDRLFANDKALMGGLARFEGEPCVVIGQHRGHGTRERIKHNFGMPNPEGYRKALRLFDMAARFDLPVFTFVDTQGAYPGVGAEERGQAEAIAVNLAKLSSLPVPVICTVIGEGGSGGALAIAVADRLNMLENSIYSVISPEGCASILWKTAEQAPTASELLGLTAQKLYAMGLADSIVPEEKPAHLAPQPVMQALKSTLKTQLATLSVMDAQARCQARYQKLMTYNSTLSCKR